MTASAPAALLSRCYRRSAWRPHPAIPGQWSRELHLAPLGLGGKNSKRNLSPMAWEEQKIHHLSNMLTCYPSGKWDEAWTNPAKTMGIFFHERKPMHSNPHSKPKQKNRHLQHSSKKSPPKPTQSSWSQMPRANQHPKVPANWQVENSSSLHIDRVIGAHPNLFPHDSRLLHPLFHPGPMCRPLAMYFDSEVIKNLDRKPPFWA